MTTPVGIPMLTAKSVLAIASLTDGRFQNADVGMLKEWDFHLGGLNTDDAVAATRAFYGTPQSGERRMMPSDVVVGVRKIRAARIAAHPVVDPPRHIPADDVQGILAWQREINRRIGNGETFVAQPDQSDEALPAHDVKALMVESLKGKVIKDMPTMQNIRVDP